MGAERNGARVGLRQAARDLRSHRRHRRQRMRAARRDGRSGMGPPCAEYRLAWWEIALLDLAAVVVVGLVAPLAMIGDGAPVIYWFFVGPFLVWELCVVTAHEGVMSSDGELWFSNHLRRWRFHLEDVRSIKDSTMHSYWVEVRAFPCDVRILSRTGSPIVEAILAAGPDIEVKHVAPELPFEAFRQRKAEARTEPAPTGGQPVRPSEWE